MYSEFELKDLEKHIHELEISLFKKEIRESSEEVERLISREFMEHCSSGKVYHYKVGDSFGDKVTIEYKDYDFNVRTIDENSVLATYNLEKKFLDDGVVIKSRRSSIWKKEDSIWKMFFHQGTNFSD